MNLLIIYAKPKNTMLAQILSIPTRIPIINIFWADLLKLNPDLKNQSVNIRLIRDPDVNACAFEDGTIYVNIGLIAKYNTEAEIAAVLGHELGHVNLNHSYKNYLAYKKHYKSAYSFRSGFGESTQAASSDLISLEKESDEYSMELLNKSMFNNTSMCSVQSKFIELQEKYEASHDTKKKELRLFIYAPFKQKQAKESWK